MLHGRDGISAALRSDSEFPAAYVLSDGTSLLIADGGNNRVLVYNTIPVASGATADVVLGHQRRTWIRIEAAQISAADSLRTPTSLAWMATNLYVTDPYNRRVMVFTAGGPGTAANRGAKRGEREIFAVAECHIHGGSKGER